MKSIPCPYCGHYGRHSPHRYVVRVWSEIGESIALSCHSYKCRMCKTTWTDEPGGTGDEYADIEQAEILNKRGHLKGVGI